MKKLTIVLIAILLITSNIFSQSVGINDDNSLPDGSAMLDVKSNTRGILIPRLDFNAKPATPATGLLIFVTANGPEGNNAFYFFNGTGWTKIAASAGVDTDWTISGNDMYSAVSGNVGIGTTTPGTDLDIKDTGDGAFAWLTRTDGTPGEVITEIGSTASYGIVGTRSENGLKLRVNSIDKMYIGTDGNVGIGTLTPAQKLSVSGTIESTSGGIKFPDGTTQTTAASGGSGQPTGSVITFAGAVSPNGYLECNGSAVSRTTYADLFTVISTMYGAGDGSTTFNIPDYRGYFLRGMDKGAGADPDAATRTDRGDGTTGDNIGTKQNFEIQSHSHGSYLTTNVDAYKNLGWSAGSSFRVRAIDAGGNETRPKNISVMYCIKY